MPQVSLRELQVFLAVCECRAFSRAADRMGVSQPALSRTVRDLETRFDLRFFHRNGRGVELTQAGRVLRQHAETVISSVEDLEIELNELRESASGVVVIVLPTHVSQVVTPKLVRRFAEHYPKASLHVFEDANDRIADRVRDGVADIGLFYAYAPPDTPRQDYVAEEPLFLVELPDEDGNDDDGPITFAQLADRPLVLPRRKSVYRQFLEECADGAEVRLNVVRELEMGSTQMAFVLEREGGSILPFSHCWSEVRSGQAVARQIVGPKITRHITLIRSTFKQAQMVRVAGQILNEELRASNAMFRWQFVAKADQKAG